MADRNDASSSMITPTGATGRVHSTADGEREYGGSVVTEFLDAARSAAESLLEEQKRQVADRISGMARALQSAAQPLDYGSTVGDRWVAGGGNLEGHVIALIAMQSSASVASWAR